MKKVDPRNVRFMDEKRQATLLNNSKFDNMYLSQVSSRETKRSKILLKKISGEQQTMDDQKHYLSSQKSPQLPKQIQLGQHRPVFVKQMVDTQSSATKKNRDESQRTVTQVSTSIDNSDLNIFKIQTPAMTRKSPQQLRRAVPRIQIQEEDEEKIPRGSSASRGNLRITKKVAVNSTTSKTMDNYFPGENLTTGGNISLVENKKSKTGDQGLRDSIRKHRTLKKSQRNSESIDGASYGVSLDHDQLQGLAELESDPYTTRTVYVEQQEQHFMRTYEKVNFQEAKFLTELQEQIRRQDQFQLVDNSDKKQPKRIFVPNVPSEQQRLQRNAENLVDLGCNEFTYFHLNVKGLPTPVRVNFQMEPNSVYSIFWSKFSPVPNKFNCEESLNRQLLVVKDKTHKVFQSFEHLYFSVTSSTEQRCVVRVLFGSKIASLQELHQKQQLKPHEQHQRHPHPENPSEMDFQDLRDEYIKIRKKHAENLRNNIIQQNKELLKEQYLKIKLQNHVFRQDYNRIREEQTKVRHQENLELENQKRELYFLADQEKTLQKIKRCRQGQIDILAMYWSSKIKLLELAEKLQKFIRYQRVKKQVMKKLLHKIMFYQIKYKREIVVLGPSVDARILNHTHKSLSVLASFARKTRSRKQLRDHLIISVMRQNAKPSQIKNCMLRYYKTIQVVQRKFRNFKLKEENYKLLLLRYLNKYIYNVLGEILVINSHNPLYTKQLLQNYQTRAAKEYGIEEFYKLRQKQYREKMDVWLEFIRKAEGYQRAQVKAIDVFVVTKEDDSNFQDALLNLQKEERLEMFAYKQRQSQQLTNRGRKSTLNEDEESETPINDKILNRLGNLDITELTQKTKQRNSSKVYQKPRLFKFPSMKAIRYIITQIVLYVNSKNENLSKEIKLKKEFISMQD